MLRALLTAAVVLVPVGALAAPRGSLFPVTDDRRAPRAKPRAISTMHFAPRAEPMLRVAMMAAHNRTRREYGVEPLSWDDQLARDAYDYAQSLARSGRFEHSRQSDARPFQGETLWTGTRSAFNYSAQLAGMIDERRHFKPGRFPAVSRTGQWAHVGHYTQIVWPTTQRVGCATASNQSSDYLVCRYFPAGNVPGVVLR